MPSAPLRAWPAHSPGIVRARMYAVKRKGKNAFGLAPYEDQPAPALSEDDLAALDAAHLAQQP